MIGVMTGSIMLEWPAHTPPFLSRLAGACMHHEAAHRPTFAALAQELREHEVRACACVRVWW